MIKKLRRKFVWIMMSIVTVMLCVIFGLVIGFTRQNLEQECRDALQKAASEPGFLIEHHEQPSPLPYFVMRRDLMGNLQVSGTINFERYEDAELQQFWTIASNSDGEIGEIKESSLKYLKVSGRVGTRCVFVDVKMQQLTMRNLTRICIFVGLIAFGAMWGISLLLARWTVKPVERAWDQQRQFVADASHELKTPLTVIMTNAELLCGEDLDDGARQQFSGSILTMSRQMRGLVEGLLDLARVDNGAVKTQVALLDYSGLVQSVVLPFEPLFFEKGLCLQTGVEAGIRLKGSKNHLQQVQEILLDNAMKYTSPGGTVRVALRRQGSSALLSVAGPGPAIGAEDLENIFKRFYRIDKARSRDGSYGLGLSIARSIVSEHGGKIWAESRDGINTFYVQLPMN